MKPFAMAVAIAAVTAIGCAAELHSAPAIAPSDRPTARPQIDWRPIGFGEQRRRETRRYAERH